MVEGTVKSDPIREVCSTYAAYVSQPLYGQGLTGQTEVSPNRDVADGWPRKAYDVHEAAPSLRLLLRCAHHMLDAKGS
jgi:hypothetical protein